MSRMKCKFDTHILGGGFFNTRISPFIQCIHAKLENKRKIDLLKAKYRTNIKSVKVFLI